jgi:hypothetical protein
MKPTRGHTNILQLIVADMKEIDRRLTQIENDTVPTFPRADASEISPVGVVGQILVGDDDLLYTHNGTVWQDAF